MAKDHLGNCHATVKAMVSSHGISLSRYYRLLGEGKDLATILQKEIYVDHEGREFRSIRAMMRHHKINPSKYLYWMKKGYTLQESIQKLVESKHENHMKNFKGGGVVDFNGVFYPSVRAMCIHYGIREVTYYYRINAGKGLKIALTAPVRPKQQPKAHKATEPS